MALTKQVYLYPFFRPERGLKISVQNPSTSIPINEGLLRGKLNPPRIKEFFVSPSIWGSAVGATLIAKTIAEQKKYSPSIAFNAQANARMYGLIPGEFMQVSSAKAVHISTILAAYQNISGMEDRAPTMQQRFEEYQKKGGKLSDKEFFAQVKDQLVKDQVLEKSDSLTPDSIVIIDQDFPLTDGYKIESTPVAISESSFRCLGSIAGELTIDHPHTISRLCGERERKVVESKQGVGIFFSPGVTVSTSSPLSSAGTLVHPVELCAILANATGGRHPLLDKRLVLKAHLHYLHMNGIDPQPQTPQQQAACKQAYDQFMKMWENTTDPLFRLDYPLTSGERVGVGSGQSWRMGVGGSLEVYPHNIDLDKLKVTLIQTGGNFEVYDAQDCTPKSLVIDPTATPLEMQTSVPEHMQTRVLNIRDLVSVEGDPQHLQKAEQVAKDTVARHTPPTSTPKPPTPTS